MMGSREGRCRYAHTRGSKGHGCGRVMRNRVGLINESEGEWRRNIVQVAGYKAKMSVQAVTKSQY
jgi:hypothetical protein